MDPTKATLAPSDPTVIRRVIAGKNRMLFGWKPDRPDHRDLIMSVPAGVKLALSTDLSSKMSRIEDQGDLGSCVANSSTTAAEYLYRLANKAQPELSRLYVYYYARFLDGTPPTEDGGTFIRTAMKCLATYGACTEALWPYDTSTYSEKPSPACLADGKKRLVLRYYRTPTLAHIKLSLSEGFPVVFGFSVPESVFSGDTATTGIVAYPQPNEQIVGGHAVLAVGYDEKTQRLKFQNSWGPTWGDAGHGYLPYQYVTDGLADDFWTIRAEQFGGA